MRFLSILLTALLSIVPGGVIARARAQQAVYVSPQGDDSASGRTPQTAFRSLERAGAAVRSGNASTVYLMEGIFRRSSPFVIAPSPRPQRWIAAPGAQPVLDGGNKTGQALMVTGHDVTVQGLRIVNFTDNGIVVSDADGVTIRDNVVRHIASPGWTRAAILVVQVAKNVTVEANDVADTGYVGIGYFASAGGNLRGVRITDNRLARTCLRVADCGAIYVSGRTPTANGAIIRGNRIRDYGPSGGEAKAIYLDDGLSGAEVSRNVISGQGTYALQIHGGSDNLIVGNVINLPLGQPVLFYQQKEDGSSQAMANNRMSGNVVRAPGQPKLNVKFGGRGSGLILGQNRIEVP
ncbi:right-handed parallel beta-helix repeat-containing protein [Stakelama sp. CBK3Z-3]|uniref:Right-handed parallel beta-helix repeat-containing protein n=1 Tax=Stakelama flava TaxID=2860338 RepID=A0ABS6XJ79_9SPHN|nr:right-handed parallel beta-helix repeat-containing protein [Stakelama flava]MBW4330269.1 right-handed parallel beta-helix repeat-containing protein [Stakelama flava]